MSPLSLEQADRLATGALSEARERGFAPMAVAVADAGGHVIVAKRDNGAGHLRIAIAEGKAWGALGLGLNTRDIANLAEKIPGFVAALASTSGGRVLPSPGGVIILDSDGATLGAIGMSGDTGPNDEICVLAALRSEGFIPKGS